MKHPMQEIHDRKLIFSHIEGTKVTLINMPIRESASPNNPPIGLCYVAARLLQYDVDVTIVDLNAKRPTAHEAYIILQSHFKRHGEQDLIAMSGLITTLRWQRDIATMAREMQPSSLIASGGGLASQFGEQLFEWIPELNMVAIGEGDDIILKMVLDAIMIRDCDNDYTSLRKCCDSGRFSPYLLHDCTHTRETTRESTRERKLETKSIGRWHPYFVYRGARPKCLDMLPFPAFQLLGEDIEIYLRNPVWGCSARNSSVVPFTTNRSISMISSRGCPYNCGFCYRGTQGQKKYGVRSAAGITAEMELYLTKYGVDFVGIVDDNFMVNIKRIKELERMLEPLRNRGLRWGTHGRLDEAADIRNGGKAYVASDERRVDAMANAGCVYIGFGGESASPKVLRRMSKGGQMLSSGTTKIFGREVPLTMYMGIQNTVKAGIHPNCTWMMGYPGETLEDLKDSVAFILWMKNIVPGPINQSFFVATAYPGTALFQEDVVKRELAENFGISYGSDRKVIHDENLLNYVLELEDATKIIKGKDGNPLNYSEMSDSVFLKVREHLESGDIEKILEM